MQRSIMSLSGILLVLALLLPAGAASAPAAEGPGAFLTADPSPLQGHTPDSALMFIENAGQWDAGARFQLRGGLPGSVWLAGDAVWITLSEPAPIDRDSVPGVPAPTDAAAQGANVKLSFVGANLHPTLEPFNRLETKVSYFIGNEPDRWRPAVPVWGGVRYVDLYPGIDLELVGDGGRLAPRLIARPGADLSAVRLRVEGAEDVTVEGDALRLSTAAGDALWPLFVDGGRVTLATVETVGAGTFEVAAPFAAPAVERPVPDDNPAALLYSTFLGGGGWDQGRGVVLDAEGRIVVAGATASSSFPSTPGAFDPSFNGGVDVMVFKLTADGTGLVYATFVGGYSDEGAYGLALDSEGRAVVAGYTYSSNYPVVEPFDGQKSGYLDAVLTKLTADGTGLVFSTFIGGSNEDAAMGLALDDAGNAVLTGYTNSVDFPVSPGAFDTGHDGHFDVFVIKMLASGSDRVFGTYAGGDAEDQGLAVMVNDLGQAVVTGWTRSTGFPTTPGAFDTSHNGGVDAFVLTLTADATSLVYSTLAGGGADDYTDGLAVDSAQCAVVTGGTWSTDFPTTGGAYDTGHNGGSDAFVLNVAADGTTLLYSTFVGGDNDDRGRGLSLDATGNPVVAGHTGSSDFPTTAGAYDTAHNGGQDVFVLTLAADGASLPFSTFLGGSGDDYTGRVDHVTLDGDGNAVLTGESYSSDFPTTPGAYDTGHNGARDVVVAVLAMESVVTYAISGQITDSGGAPLPGVTVTATGGYSAVSDATGAYTIEGLPEGSYTLTPAKDGWTFDPVTRTVEVPPDATGQDFAGEPTMYVRDVRVRYIEPQPGRYVLLSTVRVLEGDGRPVAGATVDVEWTLPNQGVRPQSRETWPSGVAKFPTGSRQTGEFQICVTDVTLEGHTYDPGQNWETCETVTVP